MSFLLLFWGFTKGIRSHLSISGRLCIVVLVGFATYAGGHYINILGEGGNGLHKGTILSTLGVTVAPVLAQMLAVTTTFATPTTSTMACSTYFDFSCSAVLAETALLGRQ